MRLQWSNEMISKNAVVEDQYVAANPHLKSTTFGLLDVMFSDEMVALPDMTALDVYTAVVDALGQEGVFVILDNHMRLARGTDSSATQLKIFFYCFLGSDADWCCGLNDGNGLWFNRNYTEETFFAHWEFMVSRYQVRDPTKVCACSSKVLCLTGSRERHRRRVAQRTACQLWQ